MLPDLVKLPVPLMTQLLVSAVVPPPMMQLPFNVTLPLSVRNATFIGDGSARCCC